jgi:hypothetical protein
MTGRFKQLFWILPVAIAGLVAVLGWWANERLRQTLEGELKAQLTATLRANVTALDIWTTNQTRLATALAEDPVVRTLAGKLIQAYPPVRRGETPPLELNQFANHLEPRLRQLGYRVAQLVNTNFMVVAGTLRPQWIANVLVSDAHTNKFAGLFATGEPVIITPFKPGLLFQRRNARNPANPQRTNEIRAARFAAANGGRRRGDVTLMQVATPVRDGFGGIIGALALNINPDEEFSRILTVARSGESGETYAFDQTGLMISHSRFDDQLRQIGLLDATNASSALNLRLHDPGGDLTRGFHPTDIEADERPLISLVASAVDGEDTAEVTPSRDYRGVPVVGASCWLPDFGFGVATQINADEAYRPLRVLQFVFTLLILFIMICATALFVFVNVSWRQRLNEAELKLKQLGQYTLEEKIGEGGMGVVYRARHALLRRDTAVKLLLPDRADEASIERFEREVRLTCQLTHPNTIQIYDYGHTPDGIFYYAMEFLTGMNLHQLVARYGPQPEGRVIHILTQVCDSLAEAHAMGLIHRDIKPANVFLCCRGGLPDYVKVLDFGLVRQYSAADPATGDAGGDGVIEGTPYFTPPETITGAIPVDPRSDLYSVGAVGYFLLTGQYIFSAETVEELHQQQLGAVPPAPRERTNNPVSGEMETILLRCLEKDAALRPQSASELRAMLQSCPAVSEWTAEACVAWWNACQAQPAAAADETATPDSTPMATVRIDLESRGK